MGQNKLFLDVHFFQTKLEYILALFCSVTILNALHANTYLKPLGICSLQKTFTGMTAMSVMYGKALYFKIFSLISIQHENEAMIDYE